MEFVLLSFNRALISAESLGRGWCRIVNATEQYHFQAPVTYDILCQQSPTISYSGTQLLQGTDQRFNNFHFCFQLRQFSAAHYVWHQ